MSPDNDTTDRDREGTYEPPAIQVLGTLAQLTSGPDVNANSDGTFSGSLIPG